MKTKKERESIIAWQERLKFYASDLTKEQKILVSEYVIWEKQKALIEELNILKSLI